MALFDLLIHPCLHTPPPVVRDLAFLQYLILSSVLGVVL